jgi:hypothetical protein
MHPYRWRSPYLSWRPLSPLTVLHMGATIALN